MSALKNLIWETVFLFPVIAKFLFGNKLFCKVAFGARFAINGLDKSLSKHLARKPGYFLEIGGNDGISQSNTKRLEMFEGWSGLLVEPFQGNYERMKLTRSKRTALVNAACVPFDFEGDTVDLAFADLMTVSTSLSSDIEDRQQHVESGQKWLRNNQSVQSFKATARTLNSILEENRAPKRIQFFSLDVEGAEIPVLEGVDHSEYRFDFLLVESRSPESLKGLLGRKNYEFVEKLTGHDYLFRDSTLAQN
jgi:FkbM family methyltransferase